MNKKMIDMLLKQQKEKREQVIKLEKAMIDAEEKEERAALSETLKKVRDELNEVENIFGDIENESPIDDEGASPAEPEGRAMMLGSFKLGTPEARSEEENIEEMLEKRAADLLEGRAVNVPTGKALLAKHTGTQINDTFKQVSTLVDLVDYEVLDGGESYQEPYVISYGTGGITEEGADYTEAEPKFGYADINKIKITAYAEMSEEVKKLSKPDYARKVTEACLIALKKKISEQILNGTGTKQLTGIFASPVAIDAANDIEISAIDNKTLNELVFSYGGDEDVETMASVVLNKKTLKAMSEVEKTDGDSYYKVDLNSRTINTVPYVINSNVDDFESAVAGKFVAAYGDLKGYKIAQFSPVEIKESTDFKFKQGMICYKASVFVGGNVIKQDAFLRAKKKSS